eukprot:TRINITY_DN9626_c0_g1_i3.p1 TRINITY_DN9626_c0_g1~~TRINITY_DN9626_c0_g1_i3.p1  ORF type:complete len:758 (+),score=197.87 TRINITY_DN9626_c0_g1_i3:68-2341(+)
MPPVFIKGGVWTNVEDEVLKAAVMKYGPNQWDRVASLLHRKSAKQCKGRWYEWLDPSIKKTEWAREEEEKLLHLAKVMPNQWRTIAPIIGRTPIQCLERYEKLLDQAQAAGGEDVSDDPRRLRPGEIDPNPHTKPARPDPVDMDEDEKEMLSEARARLANTQGKKAKRKARERQLEEAKRLARLQKQRELRAAGINVRRHKRRTRGVDYNAEIPFYKAPAKGFYDPGEDEAVRPKLKQKMRSDVEGVPRQVLEEQERKEQAKKIEELKKKDMPAALMKINRLRGGEPNKKRSKLVLPAPQVSDRDLEDLVKLSKTGADALAEAGTNAASSALLQDYNETPSFQSARTPRAPAAQDSLLTEAQNILALTQTSSVLDGGENTPLHNGGGSFSGVTPAREDMSTPNRVLSTPYRGSNVVATPGREGQGETGDTPVRDKLGINKESTSNLLTPRTRREQERAMDMRSQLKQGLASLPAPKKDYDIVVPDEDDAMDQSADKTARPRDAAEIDEEAAERRRQQAEAEFKLQSQAVQRGLPLPKEVNHAILREKPADELQAADELIKQEMLALLDSDTGAGQTVPLLDKVSKAAAEQVLNQEMATMAQEHDDEDVNVRLQRYTQAREAVADAVIYVPSAKRYARASLQSNTDRLQSMEVEHKTLRDIMGKEFKKAAKMEKKLNIALGGYQKRAQALRQAIQELAAQRDQYKLQSQCFAQLRLQELQAMPSRVASMKQQVKEQQDRQTKLQMSYKQLTEASEAKA